LGGTAPAGAGSAAGGSSFGDAITSAIDNVQQVQATASSQAAQAAAGTGNIADALIASTQASLATQVTTAVTNKAIDAFTQVMNMQL
jgi:flagellar hook-basal body complex protein FliE